MDKSRVIAWQMHAFGLSPWRLPLRLKRSGGPGILCTSIPKAGTNLALRLLCLHPDLYRAISRTLDDRNCSDIAMIKAKLSSIRNGQILASHFRFSPEISHAIENADVKHLFISRDPRDVAISSIHYIAREKKHYLHKRFALLGSFNERLELILQGDDSMGLQSLSDRYVASRQWLSEADVAVKFEDLVGVKGGSNDQLQRESISRVLNALTAKATNQIVTRIAVRLFSSSTRTFRKGKIGQWREAFDPLAMKLCRDRLGNILVEYGYEEDDQW